MKRRIFNVCGDSIIKHDLGFVSCIWWLRSSSNRLYGYDVGCIDWFGLVKQSLTNYSVVVAPACMIWKSISLPLKSRQYHEHFLDFWYNSPMEQNIFNSDKSRTKIDLTFNHEYWWIRSTRHFTFVANISFYGIVRKFPAYDYNNVAPVCMIWKLI